MRRDRRLPRYCHNPSSHDKGGRVEVCRVAIQSIQPCFLHCHLLLFLLQGFWEPPLFMTGEHLLIIRKPILMGPLTPT